MDDGSELDGNGNHETLSERSFFLQDQSLKEIKCFSFSLNLLKQIFMTIWGSFPCSVCAWVNYETLLDNAVEPTFTLTQNPHFCEMFLSRFGGKQIEAYEDTGLVNYASVRDAAEEEARLEQFGKELEAE